MQNCRLESREHARSARSALPVVEERVVQPDQRAGAVVRCASDCVARELVRDVGRAESLREIASRVMRLEKEPAASVARGHAAVPRAGR